MAGLDEPGVVYDLQTRPMWLSMLPLAAKAGAPPRLCAPGRTPLL